MIETFSALAEPNRFHIVEFLRRGPKPVGDIAVALKLNQPQASKHLAVLKGARLVTVEKRAQQRVYGLCPDGLRDLNAWLENYRNLWDARFTELDDVIVELNKAGGKQSEN
jgi:DNA-binding transcriptional ArsR family regulator